MAIKKILTSVALIILITSCEFVVVLMSPSRQQTKASTIIPKKENFIYKGIDSTKNCAFYDKFTAFTIKNENYINHDGARVKSCTTIMFWPDGKFYYIGNYLCNQVFKESEHIGNSGYYYIKNDSVYTEKFSGYGLGHTYYYEVYERISSNRLKFDPQKKEIRTPKREKKHLTSIGISTILINPFYKDTGTIFLVNPSW